MLKAVYKGKIIEVVQEDTGDDGAARVFEYARRSPGVRLIIPRDDQILLTKEFRKEQGGYDYRLPGGKVFDALDEYNAALASGADIADAAKKAAIKEAREEAGLEVKDLSFFHKSVCGATVVWDLFYFVADDFDEGEQHLENGEDITVEWVERSKAQEMCLNGMIGEERTALVLLRYLFKY